MTPEEPNDALPDGSFHANGHQFSTSQRGSIPVANLIDDNYSIIDDELIVDDSILDTLASQALLEDQEGKTIDLK